MHAKLNYSRPSSISTAVAAALATFIAIGLVVAVTPFFRPDGALMAQWAAAERACQQSTYI